MPNILTPNILISVDEFIDECSTEELERMQERLDEDSHLLDHFINVPTSIQHDEFLTALDTLKNNYHQLTQSEIEIILNIFNFNK